MAEKTFKIGEYCKGGVITAKTTPTKAIVIAKEWDFSEGSSRKTSQKNAKEWDRLEVDINSENAERELRDYLEDLSTCYYADEVLKWIKSKVELKSKGFFDW